MSDYEPGWKDPRKMTREELEADWLKHGGCPIPQPKENNNDSRS